MNYVKLSEWKHLENGSTKHDGIDEEKLKIFFKSKRIYTSPFNSEKGYGFHVHSCNNFSDTFLLGIEKPDIFVMYVFTSDAESVSDMYRDIKLLISPE